MAQQYEYAGFEHHESVPELPPPEAERIIDDLPPKKHRKRARKGKKASSMIQPPQSLGFKTVYLSPVRQTGISPVNQSYLR